MVKSKTPITDIDKVIIQFFKKKYVLIARFSIFLVFFWFGLIKLLGLSPASPLAEALTAKTVGMQYFDTLFIVLAVVECIIGILFLVPKATKFVFLLLMFHMATVCSPLLLIPEYTWQSFLVPTLEGQYIIKNIIIVAVAIGIVASLNPLANKSSSR